MAERDYDAYLKCKRCGEQKQDHIIIDAHKVDADGNVELLRGDFALRVCPDALPTWDIRDEDLKRDEDY